VPSEQDISAPPTPEEMRKITGAFTECFLAAFGEEPGEGPDSILRRDGQSIRTGSFHLEWDSGHNGLQSLEMELWLYSGEEVAYEAEAVESDHMGEPHTIMWISSPRVGEDKPQVRTFQRIAEDFGV
jgi:hypothetical protein